MNNSIEWQIIESKNKDVKQLLETVVNLEEQNNNLLNKLDNLERKTSNLAENNNNILNKLDNMDIKISNLEELLKEFIISKNEVTVENNINLKKNMQVGFNYQPYNLSDNYINRMTNRLWRNSPYITTPNYFFTNLNKKKKLT